MDILNELTPERYAAADDLLAFISIYDDETRSRAYSKMIRQHRDRIRDKVCVEAGCGFGIFAELMALMGAKKVYAVEANPYLYRIASQRLASYDNVIMVHADIQQFEPDEPVDVLVHELFGQLLYDEDIRAMDKLLFEPGMILPNKAVLMAGTMDATEFTDETVTPEVLEKLNGVLVAGLFDEEDVDLQFPVVDWQPGKSRYEAICDITQEPGDLLYFGLQIYHNEQLICRAGECDNWAFVWTPRAGDRFRLNFKPDDRGMRVYFDWL